MISENYKKEIKNLAGIITCEKCFNSWEREKGDSEPFLCHTCGFDTKEKVFKIKELKKWLKDEYGELIENIGPGPTDTRPVSDIFMDKFNEKFQSNDFLSNYNPDKNIFLDDEKENIKNQNNLYDKEFKDIAKKYKNFKRNKSWKNK
jgi:hypothetical protein